MAIDDKDGIRFRGRGTRGERLARKLNSVVDRLNHATPADTGHKNVRIRKTERGTVFTGTPRGVGGVGGFQMRTFRANISIADAPHPTQQEIIDAVIAAYGAVQPNAGDWIILTSSGNAPFFAIALPQDESSPSTDFGLNYRNITVNSIEQRFLISQTGTFY